MIIGNIPSFKPRFTTLLRFLEVLSSLNGLTPFLKKLIVKAFPAGEFHPIMLPFLALVGRAGLEPATPLLKIQVN